MMLYSFKSIVCLGILYMLYLIIWERTAFHHFKRGYLLAALVISLVIPSLTFNEYIEIAAQPLVASVSHQSVPVIASETTSSFSWGSIGLILYFLGVSVFFVRFGSHLLQLWRKIKRHPHTQANGIIRVQLNTSEAPHTFLQYIFLPKEYKTQQVPKEVIHHEEAHAKQWHSLDILFIELLQVFFWFHPLLYFFKRSMKLNHEFLADNTVLKQGASMSRYQELLLTFSSETRTPALTHSIHNSSTFLNVFFSKNSFGQVKKRFILMKTSPLSKTSKWLRILFFVPILAILVWGFSTKKQVMVAANSQEQSIAPATEKIMLYVHKKEVTVNGEKIDAANFAKTVDAITKNWSKASMNSFEWDIFYDNADKGILKTLEAQFLQTKLYKVTQRGLKSTPPPPPPPPPAPDSNKAPTPPPAPETDNPPAPNRVYYTVPEPPPPPNPDPVEYVKELAKRGATFYSGPHENSLEQMLELARKSDTLQLDLSEYPIVRLAGC
tara:strand:+ start:9898 stop:11382 length:1485 start_codon:yes stop_codon:yes gene_type:complete